MRAGPRFSLPALAAALVLALAAAPAFAQDDAWTLLQQPGYVAFLRHAATSGGAGDPAGFKLDACATQRNLTDRGRTKARRIGEALAAKGIRFDRVLTSPWCRCRETARLAAGREGEVMPALSNLVGRSEHRESQVRAIRAFLVGLAPGTRALFVTHGSVILPLTGLQPGEGELFVVRVGPGGETEVAGRVRAD